MHCVFECTDIIGINNELKFGCKGKFVVVHGSIVDVFTIGCKRSNVKDLQKIGEKKGGRIPPHPNQRFWMGYPAVVNEQ